MAQIISINQYMIVFMELISNAVFNWLLTGFESETHLFEFVIVFWKNLFDERFWKDSRCILEGFIRGRVAKGSGACNGLYLKYLKYL
jgi:hypothetical protein